MTESETKLPPTDDDAQLVELTRQPIELYKILKFEGLVGSGGEAKAVIAEGHVTVNGVVETQKRKQIVSGDRLEFGGAVYRIHCDEALASRKQGASPDSNAAPAKPTAPKVAARPKSKRKKPVAKNAGRKAIGIKS